METLNLYSWSDMAGIEGDVQMLARGNLVKSAGLAGRFRWVQKGGRARNVRGGEEMRGMFETSWPE